MCSGTAPERTVTNPAERGGYKPVRQLNAFSVRIGLQPGPRVPIVVPSDRDEVAYSFDVNVPNSHISRAKRIMWAV